MEIRVINVIGEDIENGFYVSGIQSTAILNIKCNCNVEFVFVAFLVGFLPTIGRYNPIRILDLKNPNLFFSQQSPFKQNLYQMKARQNSI